MKILIGPNSNSLGKKILSKLNLTSVNFSFKQFYDGETYLQIDDSVEKEDIIIIQSTYPNQEKSLLEIMLIASTLKEMGADRVIVIIPYLCYARADKRKLKGEVLSHHLTLSYLQSSGVDSILTINVHNKELYLSHDPELEKLNLNVMAYMVKEFFKHRTKAKWVLVGPDKGSEEDILQIATELSLSHFILTKTRDPITHEITTEKPNYDFQNKDVLIIDDIISSGTTAKVACNFILECGANSVAIMFVHVLSRTDVIENLTESGKTTIYSSNTISRDDIEQIDISPILSKFIEDKFL
ncbi:MAG: ribose-phosphate pyrophosphokinase [Candidatus Heimdallarchaeota archaeon]|nr:ribose-phosphate pyrophosphokinase [Candidatus Heimdallarchaeota archaeon]